MALIAVGGKVLWTEGSISLYDDDIRTKATGGFAVVQNSKKLFQVMYTSQKWQKTLLKTEGENKDDDDDDDEVTACMELNKDTK